MSKLSTLAIERAGLSVAFAVGVMLAACGGEPDVELSISYGPAISTRAASIRLTGTTFVPHGSSCPASKEYVVYGMVGPHEMAWSNATTGSSGAAFATGWVCVGPNNDEMSWESTPITLAVGANTITVTMTAGGRTSSDTVTVTRTSG